MNDEPAAAEASDDTFGAEAEDRIRRGHLRPDFRVFLGVVPPVAFLAGNYLWSTQIAISVSVNALIAIMAGSIAVFLAGRPLWQQVQRWLMGTVLAGLAVRMLAEGRR